MRSLPISDVGNWEEWLGSSRLGRLNQANLVLLAEEPSEDYGSLDDVHERLARDLSRLFYMLHLHVGIEIVDRWDLVCGTSWFGVPQIVEPDKMSEFYRSFYRSSGCVATPITNDWLEDSVVLREGFSALQTDKTKFRRVLRGLTVLLKGLREPIGQDRIHQFVRSLEALILPDKGSTRRQFMDRCQTFARPGNATRDVLREAFDARSDTEHLNPWHETFRHHPPDDREDAGWQRTRQVEQLAWDSYSRLLRDPDLRAYFRTDDDITAFWRLENHQRREIWGAPLDITQEPLVKPDRWLEGE